MGLSRSGLRALECSRQSEPRGTFSPCPAANGPLLHDLGLRRVGVVALEQVDVDLVDRALWVRRKGRRERTLLELPPPTLAASRRWLTIGGEIPGAALRSYYSYQA